MNSVAQSRKLVGGAATAVLTASVLVAMVTSDQWTHGVR